MKNDLVYDTEAERPAFLRALLAQGTPGVGAAFPKGKARLGKAGGGGDNDDDDDAPQIVVAHGTEALSKDEEAQVKRQEGSSGSMAQQKKPSQAATTTTTTSESAKPSSRGLNFSTSKRKVEPTDEQRMKKKSHRKQGPLSFE